MPSLWQFPLTQIRCIGARSYARVRPHLGGGKSLVADSDVGITAVSKEHTPPLQTIHDHEIRVLPDNLAGSARGNDRKATTITPNSNTSSIEGLATSSNVPVRGISPSILYDHWDLAPPSAKDLQESRSFFIKHPAKLLFSATRLLDVPFTSVPEIAIVGRSNVGKSTLINSLLQTSLAKTSSKPGKTKNMNAYDLGGKMTLLDMPGYGQASRREWGVEITKYLERRKELRRVFVLIDAIHEPNEARVKREDLVMLQQLRELHIPHQIVLGKIDRALFPRTVKPPLTAEKLAVGVQNVKAIFADVKRVIWGLEGNSLTQPVDGEGLMPFGQLLAITADNSRWAKVSDERNGALGVDALRWAFLVATGLAKTLPSQLAKTKKLAKSVKAEASKQETSRRSVPIPETDSGPSGDKPAGMHSKASNKHEPKRFSQHEQARRNVKAAASQFR